MKDTVRSATDRTPEEIIKEYINPDSKMRFFEVLLDAEAGRDLRMFNRTPQVGQKATNRRMSAASKTKYLAEMRSGEWFSNPQPISFSEPDENGVIMMIDGQTRIEALIEYDKENPGVKLPFVVCVDAPRQAMAVIDRNRRRIPGDMLAMEGEKYSNKLSHALRMLYAYLKMQPYKSIGLWRALSLTPTSQEKFLNEHPSIRQGIELTMAAPSTIQSHVGAVTWYLLQQEHGPFVAEQFISGLISGANLDLDDPRLKLRQFFAQRKDQKYRWEGFEQLAFLITAANAWLLRDDSFVPSKAWKLNSPKFPALIRKSQVPEKLLTGI